MAEQTNLLALQLKQACKITGARWAVWLERTESDWDLGPRHAFGKAREIGLREYLRSPKTSTWLAGALGGRRMRARSIPELSNTLGCQRLYIFPAVQGPYALLVGTGELAEQERSFFRVLALCPPVLTEKGIASGQELYSGAVQMDLAALKKRAPNDLKIARRLDLINHVLRQVIGLTDLSMISKLAAEGVSKYFDYEFVVVLLLDEAGDQLVTAGVGGTMADHLECGVCYPANRGLSKRVLTGSGSFLSNDVTQDPEYYSLLDWQAGSEMGVSLCYGDKPFGMINVAQKQKNAFSREELILLEAIAGILASVMMNARRYQELRSLYTELQDRIAAQRLAESRLFRSAELAAIGEMASGIAHEMNNPLTTVAGFVELVLEDLPVDSPHRPDLELVLREARRARGVVRQLLDFSRPVELILESTDLNSVVQEILTLVQHFIQTGAIQLSLELAEGLPPVMLDANQMKQVFLNLVHNAMQALPKGGKLSIQTALRYYKEEEWVSVSVLDSGEGIPKENIERLFDPFFSTRPPESGTGLGLWVSDGIVKDHGGFIEVNSRVGAGSCFTVYLPIRGARN